MDQSNKSTKVRKTRKSSRTLFEPTDEQRRQVEEMAGFGLPERLIAKSMNIDEAILNRCFKNELDVGIIRANIKVAENLFRQAIKDDPKSISVAIFWAKTRMGWKETITNETRISFIERDHLDLEV